MKELGCVKTLELLRTHEKKGSNRSFDFLEAKIFVTASSPLVLFSDLRVGETDFQDDGT